MAHGKIREVDAGDIGALAAMLRERRKKLARAGAAHLQHRTVRSLAAIASSVLRAIPEYPSDPAQYALRATLACWNAADLDRLIGSERVYGWLGTELCVHIVASNTPLLAWSSAARALLVQSASILRLPEDGAARAWTDRFMDALREADPDLAGLVALVYWPSDSLTATQAAVRVADRVLVYGSDETVAQVRKLSPAAARLIAYGDRLSIGFVLTGSDLADASDGFALDMAIFDQQGCLSPQMIFVVGDACAARAFAERLFCSLSALEYLFPARGLSASARIREALEIDRLDAGGLQKTHEQLKFCLAIKERAAIHVLNAPGCAVIIPVESVEEGLGLLAVAGLQQKLQGAGVVAADEHALLAATMQLQAYGVHYVCRPGWMQRPPFDWREDGHAVLSSLAETV